MAPLGLFVSPPSLSRSLRAPWGYRACLFELWGGHHFKPPQPCPSPARFRLRWWGILSSPPPSFRWSWRPTFPPNSPLWWGWSLPGDRAPARPNGSSPSGPKGPRTGPPLGFPFFPLVGSLPPKWRRAQRRRAFSLIPPCAGLQQRHLRLRVPLLLLPAATPSPLRCRPCPRRAGAVPRQLRLCRP